MRKAILLGLFLGLSFGAGLTQADTSTGKQPPGKGKPGNACKVNSDCDQSSQPQICASGKCQVFQPPPPT